MEFSDLDAMMMKELFSSQSCCMIWCFQMVEVTSLKVTVGEGSASWCVCTFVVSTY